MRLRRTRRLLAVTALALAVLALPAHADTTTTTFTLSAGALTSTAPPVAGAPGRAEHRRARTD